MIEDFPKFSLNFWALLYLKKKKKSTDYSLDFLFFFIIIYGISGVFKIIPFLFFPPSFGSDGILKLFSFFYFTFTKIGVTVRLYGGATLRERGASIHTHSRLVDQRVRCVCVGERGDGLVCPL